MNTGWTTRQCKDFAKNAKARVGERGWAYLSDEQRRALVCAEIVSVLFSQIAPKYLDIQEMIRGTFAAAEIK